MSSPDMILGRLGWPVNLSPEAHNSLQNFSSSSLVYSSTSTVVGILQSWMVIEFALWTVQCPLQGVCLMEVLCCPGANPPPGTTGRIQRKGKNRYLVSCRSCRTDAGQTSDRLTLTSLTLTSLSLTSLTLSLTGCTPDFLSGLTPLLALAFSSPKLTLFLHS